jgi:hypothetical protein
MEAQKRKAPIRILRYITDNSVFGELFEMFNFQKFKYVIRENGASGFQFFNAITKDEALQMVDSRVSFLKKDGLTVDVIQDVNLN